jgi:hypothetical protein
MPEGYLDVQPSPKDSNLMAIAGEMLQLMMRNVATAGVVYADPAAPPPPAPERLSLPGCVLASPSCPLDQNSGKQNYVHSWTRDAAITMMGITAQGALITAADVKQRLADYISFADTCQRNAPPHNFSIACYRIDGQPRCDPGLQNCWSAQSDGPALQTLALLGSYQTLNAPVKAAARAVIERNLKFLLDASDHNTPPGVPGYQAMTYSAWEEEQGYSFFARAVQLKCLRETKDHPFDTTVPAGLDNAITWLEARPAEHWNGEYYTTFAPENTVDPPRPWTPTDPRSRACCVQCRGYSRRWTCRALSASSCSNGTSISFRSMPASGKCHRPITYLASSAVASVNAWPLSASSSTIERFTGTTSCQCVSSSMGCRVHAAATISSPARLVQPVRCRAPTRSCTAVSTPKSTPSLLAGVVHRSPSSSCTKST